MDNTTILFNTIQRVYRNALVAFIRERMTAKFGSKGIDEVKSLFMKDVTLPDGRVLSRWESVMEAARERRSGGTGELSTPIRDEFELLGVEYFFNVFEKYFDVLCPIHAAKPKKDRNQAVKVLTEWMKCIKNVRDPISHPVTDDIDFQDAEMVLYHAKKVLDFCELAAESAQVVRARGLLLGGFRGEEELILTSLPPEDEVVMDFVGRNRELVALNDWVLNGSSKRWALSGDGGKGKSAIAYAFARMMSRRDDTPFEGVLWISAKLRRFVEGTTLNIDRPDFYNAETAQAAILKYWSFRLFHG